MRIYKRKGFWWLRFCDNGQDQRVSIARLLGVPTARVSDEQARRVLKDWQRARDRGELAPRGLRESVSDALDSYLAHYRLRGGPSARTLTRYANTIRAALGRVKIAAVTAPQLRAYAEQRLAAGYAPATVRDGELAVLRAALRLAHREGKLRAVPPFPQLTVDNARQGFVEPPEAERIIAHLEQPYQDAALFSYVAARRANEVLRLSWAQVDRAAHEIRWGRTKNGRPLTLPLVGQLAEVVERRWAARVVGQWVSPWVFFVSHLGPLGYSTYRAHFVAAARAVGLAGIRPHDFRRSGVRNMIRAGVSQAVAQSISGHRSAAVFARYDITSTTDQRQALGAVERYLQTGGHGPGREGDTAKKAVAEPEAKQ
jgi:integrase